MFKIMGGVLLAIAALAVLPLWFLIALLLVGSVLSALWGLARGMVCLLLSVATRPFQNAPARGQIIVTVRRIR
jgi:hypothetical protein